ncbi:hypothetical protein COLO4_26037 [Corchorus olitorius]|uniref:Uncharacterized protein n=1 Tax=Corchorus olitorius TaxID=93759 RepID=A0A1R3HZ17_9ROSI|nr:hypothetical protein COLO4_26037 [Corchorus olitorius]
MRKDLGHQQDLDELIFMEYYNYSMMKKAESQRAKI